MYVNTDDLNEAAEVLVRQLNTIQETAVEDAAFKDYIHYFPWFVIIALGLLVAEFMLPERKMAVV